MATQTLTLKKCRDGYFRCYWYDEVGKRHNRSFGRDRTDARNEFSRFHTLWQSDPTIRTPSLSKPLSIREAWERFNLHAEAYYRRADGTPTREARNIADAFGPVLALFEDMEAREFGPRLLKLVRERMISDELCVNVINQRVRKIRQVFKWLASEELVGADVWHSLQTVTAIEAGRPVMSVGGESLEVNVSEPVRPVAKAIVDATVAHLPATLQAMVRLQLLTAMRPEDVVNMRGIEVDTTGPVWLYRPTHHKTAYRRHERTVLIGPEAQKEIREYLTRQPTSYLFSPLAAVRERNAARDTHRHQAVAPPKTGRRMGERYTVGSYAKAIKYACERADLPHWSPNQLRHTALTEIRKRFGVEVAQIVAGHRKCDVTQVYAEANREKAIEAMRVVG